MHVHAILGAGGSGTRMRNPINKSFMLLRGKPILAYSLQLFQEMPEIHDVTIVINKDWQPQLMEVINRYRITKVKEIVEGGKERQDSMRNAVEAIARHAPANDDLMLIHNAANPLVTKEIIRECIRAAQLHRAAVAGYRVKDTIKRVHDDGKIIETLNRNELWGMQTPQCVEFELYYQAHQKAKKEGFMGTDDVQLVERLGVKAQVVDCGYDNIKITTPEDIMHAERILERRESSDAP
ncbi:MAG: 2-C-methyl-D-erythritol 4-phosphate cytidylyltransferase [Candidatus Iainarchaeum archaeon]|uniref:2-C-methyl-D-erythritol 4-phosphate cytidylyltransferase n=1 Tax=Candidatus Iainarchaeum sp. TaxID=3101447 RepID=A0A7T9DIW4_9ARCH|nr:MAG: 2-C-methyl-D-erythritol 4-phosphate cytidylyltransferase [Candidatus Diapherotrites archaeon]